MLSYNLKYRKVNVSSHVFIEKEGEILLYEKGFRLKGKGAGDKGELIHFSDIKALKVMDESMVVLTFTKDRYEISNAGSFWDQFLMDFFKVRNEFLQDALFMRQGSVSAEFEANFQRSNVQEEIVSKGRCKLRLYERSIIVIPEKQDVFCVNFSFIKVHEFDEDEYSLKIALDTGAVIVISQLRENFDEFMEHFNGVMARMYDVMFKELEYTLMGVKAPVLVKLVGLMKNGKAVSYKDLQKIDKELPKKFMEIVSVHPALAQNFSMLGSFPDPERTYFGVSIQDGKHDQYLFTVMHAIPEKNILALTIGTRDKDTVKLSDMYFFKIIMEYGNAEEKIPDKILELNQALLNLHFVIDPLYRDKRELRRSPYKFAIRKLSYLRLLRRSYIGRAPQYMQDMFQKYMDRALEKSKPAHIS